jgi:DNA topoisomerase-3
MWKTMASRQFEPEEVSELLAKGRVGPLQGFRSKMGRPFEALVKLGDDKKPLFDFGENGLDAEQKVDKDKHEAIGLCPICHKGQVHALARSFACENAIHTPKTCSFRVSKTILHRDIPKDQVQKLITTGKTDLLHKFISRKGRPFSAYLKLQDGKVGFEFEERKPRSKKKITAPKAAAA